MAQPRQQQRVPLLAPVQAATDRPLGLMYAVNISGGGVYLKAPRTAANEIPTGTGLSLSFSLSGEPLEVSGHVVWVDADLRDHRGHQAVGLGVRFTTLSAEAQAELLQFIDSFRYRVAVRGFGHMLLAEQSFGDLFALEPVADAEALAATLERRQTGLILVGDHGQNPAEVLADLLKRESAERPPILVVVDQPSQELERLVMEHARVTMMVGKVSATALRSLVRHSVECYALNFENELLATELSRALDRLRRENHYLRARIGGTQAFAGMVGDSLRMREVYALIEQVAPYSTGVLILGETGTGKELVARAIHERSPRSERPFIAQNCAALSDNLLDSELFGHTRGAFTGATHDRVGLFEAADTGTILLDEVGEMSLSMQAKLLRVLQNGEARRVGDNKTRHVDVRVLCATHRDLVAMVRAGTFREDLYYRLRTFVIDMPSLSARREDIAALVMHFLQIVSERHGLRSKGVSEEALRILGTLDWPGNVRELEHAVERLFVHAGQDGEIDGALVRRVLGVVVQHNEAMDLPAALERFERQRIHEALQHAAGNITQAAKTLGIDRTTLSKRRKRLGL